MAPSSDYKISVFLYCDVARTVAESYLVQHAACCTVSGFCFGLCCKNGQKPNFHRWTIFQWRQL